MTATTLPDGRTMADMLGMDGAAGLQCRAAGLKGGNTGAAIAYIVAVCNHLGELF